MDTQAVLTWFRVALPLLAAPGVFAEGVELSERVLLQLGHEVTKGAIGSWQGEAPEPVVRALEAAGAALTAVQISADPGPSLRESLDATVAYLGGGEEVEGLLLVGRTFPEPAEPVGGQRETAPADRARPTIPPPPTRQQVLDGLKDLRAVLFPSFAAWCRSVDVPPYEELRLDPKSKRGEQLRYALLDAWYDATSLSGREKEGRVIPAWRFIRPDADPGLVGSVAWLKSLRPEECGVAMDRVLMPHLNNCEE